MRGLFVTGTGTGVGKTVLSAALALSRSWSYWKPIQTGPESDTATVRILANCPVFDVGIRLPEPVAPYLAAQKAGWQVKLSDVMDMVPKDGDWIVEGAGGSLVPVNESEMIIDLIEMLGLPVVIASRTTLGTINHTLLTLAALRARNLPIDRVVMVGDRHPENKKAIETYGKVKVDELPWMEPLTPYTMSFHKL